MVICTTCKHFVMTSNVLGDLCDVDDMIMDDDIVYSDVPCECYVPMDSNDSKN